MLWQYNPIPSWRKRCRYLTFNRQLVLVIFAFYEAGQTIPGNAIRKASSQISTGSLLW